MSDIEWEDPPPAATRRSQLVPSELVLQLQDEQGRWAIVRRGVKAEGGKLKNWAQTVRRGRSAFGQGFEAVYREVDGEARVYARYVGE